MDQPTPSLLKEFLGVVREYWALLLWGTGMTIAVAKTTIEHRILWKKYQRDVPPEQRPVAVITCGKNREECRADMLREFGHGDKRFSRIEEKLDKLIDHLIGEKG